MIPNRGELALLAGGESSRDLATVADQARTLDVAVVIATLGGQGAMAVLNEAGAFDAAGRADGPDVVILPAMPVTAVDTTAAGDSFCGAFAVALAGGAPVVDAMGWAVRVAGHTVTVRGAQDSLPHLADVGGWDPEAAPT